MLKLFKNFFSLKRFSKATIISLVLFSIVLGLIFPIRAEAALWDWVNDKIAGAGSWLAKVGPVGVGAAFASAFIGVQSTILIAITLPFLGWCQSFLNWVMSPSFVAVKFTDNTFVNVGWEITRNLTNIAIVLGLVVIALATILRISTYHAKKTLPLLLIVALLVNFSPVICGIVIDASNIVMNYFLKGGGLLGEELVSTLGTEISILFNQMLSPSATLGKAIVLVGFNLIGGIVFLLYALLFLLRYIALWMLVILSPLAFFCYVFPFTRKWWDMWRNQFFQWCIIGIPAAFSIFLANHMIKLATDPNQKFFSAPSGVLSEFGNIVPYIIPLAFLVVGIFMSLQAGAAGANIVTGAFQKYVVGGGKKAAGWLTRRGWQMLKEETREPRKKIGERLRRIKIAREMKEIEEDAHGRRQAGRWAAGWALRPLGRILEAGAAGEAAGEIKAAEEKAKGKTLEAMALTMDVGGLSDAIGTLVQAIKSKKLSDIRERGLITDEKLEMIAKATVRERPELLEDIRDAMPKVVGEIGKEMDKQIEQFKIAGKKRAAGALGILQKRAGIYMSPEDLKKYGTLTEKIRTTAKPSKMDLWSKGEMQEALASTIFKTYMTPGQLSQLAKTFESDFFTTWDKVAPSKKWLERWNEPVARYIERSPSGAFGIPFGTKEPSVSVMGEVSRKWSKEEKKEEIPITKKRVPRGRRGPRPGGRGRPGV